MRRLPPHDLITLPLPEDAHRFPFMVDDYVQSIQQGDFPHSLSAWRSWVLGYRDGEEIGLRAARRNERRAVVARCAANRYRCH
jgi:hypothetical protein